MNQIERVLSREVEGSEGGSCTPRPQDNTDSDVPDKQDTQDSMDSILLQEVVLQNDSLPEWVEDKDTGEHSDHSGLLGLGLEHILLEFPNENDEM